MEQKRVDIARLALSPPSPLACTGQRTNRERGLRPAVGHVKARSAGTYPTFRSARGPFPLHSSALTQPTARRTGLISIGPRPESDILGPVWEAARFSFGFGYP